jgi:hypothetical protein
MAGHHTGDQPRTPCGGLGAPALSHAPAPPGWHPGLDQHPRSAGVPAAAPPGRRPSGGPGLRSTSCQPATANAAPSLPSGSMAAGDHAARRPRGHVDPLRPTGAARTPVRRGADSAAAAPRTPQACPSGHLDAPDTWTPDAWTLDVRSTGGRTFPTAGPDEADRATTGLAGVRTPSRPATTRRAVRPRPVTAPGALDPGRLRGDGTCAAAGRRRHWTAASTARHEAAPRRTALVLELDGTRREQWDYGKARVYWVRLVRGC